MKFVIGSSPARCTCPDLVRGGVALAVDLERSAGQRLVVHDLTVEHADLLETEASYA